MTLFIQSHRYNTYLYLKENTELLGFSIGSEGKEFAMQETWVPSLGQEDPLEKGMNGYPLQYSCLKNSTDRGYSPWGHKELGMTELLALSLKYQISE